ncbi:hypothetical protein [Nocardioides sp.]|uniref:hypothetical protein n=1 Tax=Nocardioides sp. TaxID=35761 RepID=UPI0035280B0C
MSTILDLDPFDLPGWLGEGEVVWEPETSIAGGSLVRGRLTDGDRSVPCDLLAVDEAYPSPVAGDGVRRQSHQAWRHGQVHLVEHDGRPTLAVPGRDFTADAVLEAVGRLAKAVGAETERYSVLLRLGESRGG